MKTNPKPWGLLPESGICGDHEFSTENTAPAPAV